VPPLKASGEITVEAPAEEVWEVLARQFSRIGDWATAVPASWANPEAQVRTDAPEAGRVCKTGVPMIPRIEDTIVAYDDAARTLTYEAAGMPTFVGTAQNSWQVTAVDERRALARFDGVMETRGIVGRLLGLFLRVRLARESRRLLDDLKHFVETGRPSPRKQRQLGRSEPEEMTTGRDA